VSCFARSIGRLRAMAYALTWLPDVLAEAGLAVERVPGWESRGRGDIGEVLGVLCHHTGGPRHGNLPSLGTLLDGRPGIPGPLAQLAVGRDGTFYVLAAGRCNHAGAGQWGGISGANRHFIGIEGENDGTADDLPWPGVQWRAYVRGVAAVLLQLRLPVSACAGHKEYALARARCTDPSFDMEEFRHAVAADLRLLRAATPRLGLSGA